MTIFIHLFVRKMCIWEILVELIANDGILWALSLGLQLAAVLWDGNTDTATPTHLGKLWGSKMYELLEVTTGSLNRGLNVGLTYRMSSWAKAFTVEHLGLLELLQKHFLNCNKYISFYVFPDKQYISKFLLYVVYLEIHEVPVNVFKPSSEKGFKLFFLIFVLV